MNGKKTTDELMKEVYGRVKLPKSKGLRLIKQAMKKGVKNAIRRKTG